MRDESTVNMFLEIIREKLDYSVEAGEEEVRELIASTVYKETLNDKMTLSQREELCKILFDSIRKLDILQELIEDDEVSEIMVNGYENIFVERNGVLNKWDKKFASKEKFEDVIQQIVSGSNRTVNESEPIVDSRLTGGERVNVVLSPPALNGPILTIRRFPKEVFTMETLVEKGSISKEAADLMSELVVAGYNIFVSGGTSSGKTTMLNALSGCIPSKERVVTIEDSAELQLSGIENIVKLETRNANSSGCGAITIRDLIRTSLRMRPDRLIVGEVRGGEVVDMLQAFNTGHEGSMSTGHANSSNDMLVRLEAMYMQAVEIPLEAIKRQIASGIDIMVHLERERDGRRYVTEINEVYGVEEGQIVLSPLFTLEQSEKGYVLTKTNELTNRRKLEKLNGLR